ncbi:sodium:proton antiporter [Acaryochloris sp. CCMEE 5410]|uniref:cation:proton antiporter n=1 Tax=Acaryochloris sp. CCMEE 5410 TaxID=310037 RepID=UPI0002483EC0|nr:sodium:proton antiporter [Acaryochloris sp. CCMEE 5410]KAI9129782.1 sodium:proton antiporter [Acaryochloris sp. CCMEE 5410]
MVDTYLSFLLIIGLLILTVTLGSGWISRLPLSYALIYLMVGVLLGPYGIGILQVKPSTALVERYTEFVVIVSVFGCGMKMNRPLNPANWQVTGRLIGILMPLSIGAIALFSHGLLDLDWGPAILLGAILAPTDPVLASEVQMGHLDDHDELRFGLTSEGGLNDSLAFPFVYFGLYWLQKGYPDDWLQQWVVIDLLWAITAGILMGTIVAQGIYWIDQQLQRHQPADDLMEDLVVLSTILLTYALTEIVNGYGFLAVFVAGMTLRSHYRHEPDKRLAQMTLVEQFEKLLEIITIVLLGSLLIAEPMLQYAGQAGILAGFLLIVIRPLGAWISLLGSCLPVQTHWLFGWFGIRGVGSLYYLTYALNKGVEEFLAKRLTWIVYIVVVTSIVLHGVSTSPLMRWYHHKIESSARPTTE